MCKSFEFRQGPRPARGRQLSESKSLLPSSSLFSGDAFDDVLFHFSAFSDSSEEDRFCRLHLARRFLNQTCCATGEQNNGEDQRRAPAPRQARAPPGLAQGTGGTRSAHHQKGAGSRFRIFIRLPGPKTPSRSLRAAPGMFPKSRETQGEPSIPGWRRGAYFAGEGAPRRSPEPTSTFSSRRCTFRASCSRVPTSGYLVSW